MNKRRLTITLRKDWRTALRDAGSKAASARGYLGETLNFETPGAFFGRLTERRWAIVRELQLDAGAVGVGELARRIGRDVKRVHEDAAALVELGLVERTPEGALHCPYHDIHVDMHLEAAA